MRESSKSHVRYRGDTGWELRCDSCAKRNRQRFWPLTHEFWDPAQSMLRCRACLKDSDARRHRRAYLANPELKRIRSRRYYRANGPTNKIIARLKWQAIKADPLLHERAKARSREASRRYRERKRAA